MNDLAVFVLIHATCFFTLVGLLAWTHGIDNMKVCVYQFFHPFKTLQTQKQRAFLMIVLVSLLLGSIAIVTRYERPRPAKKPVSWEVASGTIEAIENGGEPYTFFLHTTSGRVYSTLITEEGAKNLIGRQIKEVMSLADNRIVLELSGGGALLATRVNR